MSEALAPAQTPASSLKDAHGYLDRVLKELQALKSPQKDTLVGVLQYLSDHIRITRHEIGALKSTADRPILGDTADELEEILTETARAANTIMDAAETIERVASTVPDDAAQKLTAAATSIYKASSFQDITGQRITKVVRALQSLEEKLISLAGAFDPVEEALAGAVCGDEALLNGPQRNHTAASQADIDALFDTAEAIP